MRGRHRSLWSTGALVLATTASLTFGHGSAANAAETPAHRAVQVELQSIDYGGDKRTYIAAVFDETHHEIANADLDLGGLSADPDLRVPTVAMKRTGNDQTYRALVSIPADGDWVIVIRVHAPTQLVQLFTDHIEGTGTAASHHGSALDPSRRAVLAADPTFFQRYNPSVGTGTLTNTGQTTPAQSLHHDGSSVTEASSTSLDPVGIVAMTAHSAGALAWMIAILGLVIANRVGPGLGRNELFDLISARYRLLAGGGLLVLAITGMINVQKNTPGLTNPRALMQTNLGTAYVALFGFKMVLFVASLITTHRIDRLLTYDTPSSISVVVNGSITTARSENKVKAFRLAETNALLGGAILLSVALLGQIHHVLH